MSTGQGWHSPGTVHLCRGCMIKCADELRGQRFLQVMKELLKSNGYEVEHNAKVEDLSKRIDELALTYPGEDVEAADMSSLVTELREELDNTRTDNARLNRMIELEVERTETAQRRAAAAMSDSQEQKRLADEVERGRPTDPPGIAGTDEYPSTAAPTDAVAAPATTAEPPADWTPPKAGDLSATSDAAPAVIAPGDEVYGGDERPPLQIPDGDKIPAAASRHQPGSKPWHREMANAEGVPFKTRDGIETIETRRNLYAQTRKAGVTLTDSTNNSALAAELGTLIEAQREAAAEG